MKHIGKGAGLPELTRWNLDRGQAPAEWEDLPAEIARALKAALVAEQGHLCCYCGRRILAGDYHVEHLVPRHGPMGDASLTFVYPNLLASCQANIPRREPRHCGTAKGDWYVAGLMASPLDPACERRFVYDLDGKVRGADPADEGAKETIARLDLDGERLRGLRRRAIESLFDGLDPDLGPDERCALLASYQARDGQDRFQSFCFVLATALRSLYGDD